MDPRGGIQSFRTGMAHYVLPVREFYRLSRLATAFRDALPR